MPNTPDKKGTEKKQRPITDKEMDQVSGGMRPRGVGGSGETATSTTSIADQTSTADSDIASD